MTLNAVYKQEKLASICQQLTDDPLKNVDDIVQELARSNFSISLYEKIFVERGQIAYINLLLKNYKDKGDKGPKIKGKIAKLEDLKSKIESSANKDQASFDFLFRKPMSHYYY